MSDTGREEKQQKNPLKRALNAKASRRQVLAGGLGIAGGALLSRVASAQEEPPPDTWNVPGRPAGTVGRRSPFEPMERIPVARAWPAPLHLTFGVVTPSDVHFAVSHAGVPDVDPRTFNLLVHGMVDRPTVYTWNELLRFPSISAIQFIECGGNSVGGLFNPAPFDTVQAIHGLTSTSEWTGVLLSTILKEVGVKSGAKWILAESQDGNVYGRSIPMDKAMDDILLAYGQNGEALRPEQGYPLRLLVPGWEGSINVKWLRRLEVSDKPFMTREDVISSSDVWPDGSARIFTFDMGVKSLVSIPTAGQRIPEAGYWQVTGRAGSGAGKVTRVEVSTDGGRTWADARLQHPVISRSHVRFTFPWDWRSEEAVVMSRATDETGQVQPTLEQVLDARSEFSLNHNNAIYPWKVESDGRVVNVGAPSARVLPDLGGGGAAHIGCAGCRV